jgi:hypothetical protein
MTADLPARRQQCADPRVSIECPVGDQRIGSAMTGSAPFSFNAGAESGDLVVLEKRAGGQSDPLWDDRHSSLSKGDYSSPHLQRETCLLWLIVAGLAQNTFLSKELIPSRLAI